MSRYKYELPDHPVKMESVELSTLTVDLRAQRTLTEKRITALALNWITDAAGVLTVSHRKDGIRVILDGQGRAAAAARNGVTHLNAEVHYDLTLEDESTLFLIRNREASKVPALEEYRIGLNAYLPLFVDTKKVLDAHKLMIGSTSTNSIGAVQGILRIVETHGPETLERVITVAEMAWGRNETTWDGMILGGLGRFLGKHPDVNDADLAKKLAGLGSSVVVKGKVMAQATMNNTQQSGTGGRTLAAYQLFVAAYNKSRRKNTIAA